MAMFKQTVGIRRSIDTKICHSPIKQQPKLAVKDLFTVSQAFNPGDNLIAAFEQIDHSYKLFVIYLSCD
jgi:hypothetical protein